MTRLHKNIFALTIGSIFFGTLFLFSPALYAAGQDLVWEQTENPSNEQDGFPYMVEEGDYIYVAGTKGGSDKSWRIEKRNQSDGALVWGVGSNPTTATFWGGDVVTGIAVDATGVYVVGRDVGGSSGSPYRFRIEKRSLSTGALLWVNVREMGKNSWHEAVSITDVAVDSTGLYVVGQDSGSASASCCNWLWVMEKHSLSNGSLLWSQTSDPSGPFPTYSNESPLTVTVDGSSVYVGGYDEVLQNNDSNTRWRIEKRNSSNGSLLSEYTGNTGNGIGVGSGGSFDDAIVEMSAFGGDLYVLRYSRSSGTYLEGMSSGGALNWSVVAPYGKRLDVDGNGIYLTGYKRGGFTGSDTSWVVEERSLGDGSAVWEVIENYSLFAGDNGTAIEVVGDDLYIAGIVENPSGSDNAWRFEKRSDLSSVPTTTPTTTPLTPTADVKANGSDGPITVANGASATISWTSGNVDSCNVAPSGWTGTSNAGISTGALTATITYTLDCTGVNGPASDSVTINVTPSTIPPTGDIKANGSDGPISIPSGTSASISWTSSDATSCTVLPSGWTGTSNAGISSGNLTSGVTYELYCTGPGGSDVRVDSVVVNVVVVSEPAPVVDLKVNGQDNVAINSGDSAVLTWSQIGGVADSCTAVFAGGVVPVSYSGSLYTYNPTSDTTYTISCTGPGGNGDDSASVTVNTTTGGTGPTLFVNPNRVQRGATTTVSWDTEGRDGCTISGSNGDSIVVTGHTGSASSGTIIGTTEYTLLCPDNTSASDTVTVLTIIHY